MYSSPGSGITPSQDSERRPSRLPWIIAGLAVVAALGFGYLWNSLAGIRQPVIHTSILPAANTDVRSGGALALSPDGSFLAYIAVDAENGSRLWLRPLKSPTAVPIAGTRDAYFPFWSPDSRFVGFFADGALKKVEAGSGAVTTICNAALPSGASWNDEGTIIFTTMDQAGIFRISAQGGTPTLVMAGDSTQEDIAYSTPYFLPDGDHFLYSVNNRIMVVTTDRDLGGIFMGSLGSTEHRKLLDVSSNAIFAGGHLFYVAGNNLLAQKFDPAAGTLTGDPALIAEQVDYSDRTGTGSFSLSGNGMLAYQDVEWSTAGYLSMYDRKGELIQTVGKEGNYDDPVFSPDGKRLAFTLYGGPNEDRRGDIWIADLGRGAISRFTFSPEEEDDPVWTPDGENIIYSDVGEISIKPSSGIGDKRVLYRSKTDKVPTDISRDGQYLLFCDFGTKTGRDIWALPLKGEAQPVPVAVTDFSELSGHFSPDGKWIAYASNETGRMEIYVRSFPSTTGKWQISTEGGSLPQWDASGSTLYYIDSMGQLTSVPVTATGNSIRAGTPVPLFRSKLLWSTSPGHMYDVSADGQSAVFSEAHQREYLAEPIHLIINWASEFEKQ